ncbi:39S ribosomal protein L23, mitochondrial isoform X2 [Silurus meridionalis]|uniref:39S ribosomal protein L23, mitochondrial isoform X2 n=1 Tax=Silurus meridionalis TaxID=175797 RepID=UPI001EECC1B2|nr:39S ribosomal protein L23, mitochondrial isoform X2 [Silurus meridionalis]
MGKRKDWSESDKIVMSGRLGQRVSKTAALVVPDLQCYPLYQLGNPQLRIFRPTFSMTLVRPGKPQPQDTVQFRVSMEMTKFDVKNYLEKIYNVPVAAVRTRIQYCSNKKRNHLNQRVKRPDYKVAYVQLTSSLTLAILRRVSLMILLLHHHILVTIFYYAVEADYIFLGILLNRLTVSIACWI